MHNLLDHNGQHVIILKILQKIGHKLGSLTLSREAMLRKNYHRVLSTRNISNIHRAKETKETRIFINSAQPGMRQS